MTFSQSHRESDSLNEPRYFREEPLLSHPGFLGAKVPLLLPTLLVAPKLITDRIAEKRLNDAPRNAEAVRQRQHLEAGGQIVLHVVVILIRAPFVVSGRDSPFDARRGRVQHHQGVHVFGMLLGVAVDGLAAAAPTAICNNVSSYSRHRLIRPPLDSHFWSYS